MTASDLLNFRDELQGTFEDLFPAEITLPGINDPVPCAGGNFRQVESALQLGSLLEAYDVAFRVRKALVPEMPTVGTTLVWNERTFRIMRVAEANTDNAWVIGADNAAK